MTNIFSQLNPMAGLWLLLLVIGAFGGIYVLRLVRKGATKPSDIVQATKDRRDQKKARKVAVKEAEAAIAAPVASSRLSRIGVRGTDEAVTDEVAEASWPESEPTTAIEAADWDDLPTTTPIAADEALVEPEYAAVADEEPDFEPVETEADVEPLAEFPSVAADVDEQAEAEALVHPAEAFDDAEPAFADEAQPVTAAEAVTTVSDRPTPAGVFDLADPDLHPANWEELLAVVRVLKIAIQRSWSEDVLAPALRTRLYMARAEAGLEVDDCPKVRAAAQQMAATDLARTINSAAREQAAEIIAVVEDCAHQMVFTAQDCSAVMTGLSEIQWMALIDHDGELEKRTMPLTRHDPEAPLWVAEALDAMQRAEPVRAVAA